MIFEWYIRFQFRYTSIFYMMRRIKLDLINLHFEEFYLVAIYM